MPSPDEMIAVVEAYVDGFAREDVAALADLFAEDAVHEDPVGTLARHGQGAIAEFLAGSVSTGAKLTIDGPYRIGPDYIAFPMHVNLRWEGHPMRVEVIDVFHFNQAGKIRHLLAYFGAGNFVPA
jgi:steroid delta-isomerase